MFIRLAVLLMVLGFLCAPEGMGMGKRKEKAMVSFHIETEASDNPKMIFPQEVGGQTRYFRRIPDISIKDIAAYTPFPAEGEYGVVFRLKGHSARRLSAVTATNQGRWLLAVINGRAVDAVMIDQQIEDGVMVVWKGLGLADIDTLDETLPRAGEDPGGRKKKR